MSYLYEVFPDKESYFNSNAWANSILTLFSLFHITKFLCPILMFNIFEISLTISKRTLIFRNLFVEGLV